MTIIADKIERLVFVKYLLKQAEISKELNRPLSSTTILTLHDAVECFLQLAYEHLTGKSKLTGNNILDTYSDKINDILKDNHKPLINKAFIKRINELRNQLKHATIFIDNKNIQNLFSETELFFIDFTKTIFDIIFSEISLTRLISHDEIRKYLVIAEKDIEENNFQLALFSIGKAFYELDKLATEVKGEHGENILSKHHRIDYISKYRFSRGESPTGLLRNSLKEIAEDINRVQDDLHDFRKALSLSVDFKQYKRFQIIIPYVTKLVRGETGEIFWWIPDEEKDIKKEYSKSQTKFCFDFVMDISLQNNHL